MVLQTRTSLFKQGNLILALYLSLNLLMNQKIKNFNFVKFHSPAVLLYCQFVFPNVQKKSISIDINLLLRLFGVIDMLTKVDSIEKKFRNKTIITLTKRRNICVIVAYVN